MWASRNSILKQRILFVSIARVATTKIICFNMPSLSPTMTSATIQKWYIKSGDVTTNYQLILQMAVRNLTALEDGRSENIVELEILEELAVDTIIAAVGNTVCSGDPLVTFVEPEEDNTKLLNQQVCLNYIDY